MLTRDDGDREINHHGTLLPAEEKKDVSEKNELFKPSKKKMDLISRNEKIQVEVKNIKPTKMYWHVSGSASKVQRCDGQGEKQVEASAPQVFQLLHNSSNSNSVYFNLLLHRNHAC